MVQLKRKSEIIDYNKTLGNLYLTLGMSLGEEDTAGANLSLALQIYFAPIGRMLPPSSLCILLLCI